jgi:hypothetical protein
MPGDHIGTRRRSCGTRSKPSTCDLALPAGGSLQSLLCRGSHKSVAPLLTYRRGRRILWRGCPTRRISPVASRELGTGMTVTPKIPQQGSGVLGSFNMSADRFPLLPREDETNSAWTAAQWAETRRGWIFITPRPIVREALPSQRTDRHAGSTMGEGTDAGPETRLVRDRPLATLQRLPQPHTWPSRKTASRRILVIPGFQSHIQMEACYGHDAEGILSQPATKSSGELLSRVPPNG